MAQPPRFTLTIVIRRITSKPTSTKASPIWRRKTRPSSSSYLGRPLAQRRTPPARGGKVARDRKAEAVGVSVNRGALQRHSRRARSVADAVRVIYNIFDQNPEDALFPICRMKDVAVIARVPFDEGTLTGTLTVDSSGQKAIGATLISSRKI